MILDKMPPSAKKLLLEWLEKSNSNVLNVWTDTCGDIFYVVAAEQHKKSVDVRFIRVQNYEENYYSLSEIEKVSVTPSILTK